MRSLRARDVLLTATEHQHDPESSQQDRRPVLYSSLIIETDPGVKRVRENGDNKVLDQDIREDSEADDKRCKSFRSTEGVSEHIAVSTARPTEKNRSVW